ncbi:unnamed protein product [Schistocephalus solidus]|uniref:Mediator of RNA polymerase II transcription subunit 26 n=1 Tax=Schistocephalus solidus TaxID=70667 RepID=A0A183SJS6_SCHSO|nr:unnamed protein product [Schistocephalus solidus]
MSMVQLQETRIGQLLQAIRHKVELTLQKRIRAIIKAWQKLLLPGQAHTTIIPLQVENRPHSSVNLTEHLICSTSSPSGINNNIDSSVNNLDFNPAGQVTPSALRSSSLPHTAEERAGDTPDLSHTRSSYPPDRTPLTLSKHDRDVVNRMLREPIITPKTTIVPSCANKHVLSKANGSSHLVASPKLNGRTTSHAVARLHHTPARSSVGPPSDPSETMSHDTASQLHERRVPTTVTTHHRLAKVKSTAELIRAAEGCLDSVTVDRILSNRIAKESDEPPRIVPPTTVRSARQPKNVQHSTSVSQVNKSATVAAIGRSSTDVPTAKSEMMAKFLESTVIHHQQTEMKTRIPELPVSAGAGGSRVASTAPRSPLAHESDKLVSTPQPADLAYSGDDLDAIKRQHKDRKRHKHRGRHHDDAGGSDHASRHHRKRISTAVPPISNRMNEWPELPPLPSDVEMSTIVTAADDDISAPTSPELRDMSNVERLMSGSWVGVNSVLDGEQNPQPMTALYSVGLDEDNLVHVLPWVNLYDYQQTFFPSDSNELERLSKLPDPW